MILLYSSREDSHKTCEFHVISLVLSILTKLHANGASHREISLSEVCRRRTNDIASRDNSPKNATGVKKEKKQVSSHRFSSFPGVCSLSPMSPREPLVETRPDTDGKRERERERGEEQTIEAETRFAIMWHIHNRYDDVGTEQTNQTTV